MKMNVELKDIVRRLKNWARIDSWFFVAEARNVVEHIYNSVVSVII